MHEKDVYKRQAILLSLGVMATNPFGVGADNLMNLIASNLVDGLSLIHI